MKTLEKLNKLLSSAAVLVAFVAVGSAEAADLPVKAPPMAAAPVVYSWTGFYLGVDGGYGWSSQGSDIVTTNLANAKFLESQGFAVAGGFYGGQVGYDQQFGNVVLGVEADIQKSFIDDAFQTTIVASGGNPFAVQASQNISYFGTVRGRLGYAFGPLLAYGTGGLAYGKVTTQHFQNDAALTFTVPLWEADVKTGFAVGGGFEYKLYGAWSAKAEYQFVDLGHQNVQTLFQVGGVPVPGNLVRTNNIDANFSSVRIGLNYSLSGVSR